MSEYDQGSNEEIHQYKNRINALWHEDGKSAMKNSLFLTEKFFIRIFIDGIYDYQVKRKMQKWLDEEKNPEISKAVDLADDYQEIENENILPDDLDIDENNNQWFVD